MGMRKFWSVALPFSKVASAVKVWQIYILLPGFIVRKSSIVASNINL